jgi:site-specific recombinase XerD
MQEAVKRAKLPDDCTVYSLRHTYASQSILAGMNLKLLAENMGTSILMLEEHYGKFIAKTKQKLVEETGFRLGLKRGNIESIS